MARTLPLPNSSLYDQRTAAPIDAPTVTTSVRARAVSTFSKSTARRAM